MKALIVCKYLTRFLPAVIHSLMEQDVEPVVSHNIIDWDGEPHTPYKEDNTVIIAKSYGVEVLEGEYHTEEDQRNDGIKRINDSKILIIDADEIILDIDKVKSLEIGAYAGRFIDYWKDLNHVIFPPRAFRPTILCSNNTTFSHQRITPNTIVTDIPIYHLSFCFSDEEMKWKAENYYDDNNPDNQWYENVWKKWDTDHNLTNLGISHHNALMFSTRRVPVNKKVQDILRSVERR